MTTDDETTVPLPLGPCGDCFREKLHGDRESGVMVVHCEHNQSGSMFNPKLDQWRIVVPITRDGFEQYLTERFLIADDLARGIKPGDGENTH